VRRHGSEARIRGARTHITEAGRQNTWAQGSLLDKCTVDLCSYHPAATASSFRPCRRSAAGAAGAAGAARCAGAAGRDGRLRVWSEKAPI
jgi:hypothetical protein